MELSGREKTLTRSGGGASGSRAMLVTSTPTAEPLDFSATASATSPVTARALGRLGGGGGYAVWVRASEVPGPRARSYCLYWKTCMCEHLIIYCIEIRVNI